MKQIFSVILFYSAFCCSANAIDPPSFHAPGFGNPVGRKGLWSVMCNPAGLTAVEHFQSGIFYRNAMFMDELSSKGLVLVFPVSYRTPIAIGVQRFGYRLYNETEFNVALARRFSDKVDAGISFDYFNYAFGNEYGSASLISATAGLNLYLSKQVHAGVLVSAPADIYTFRGTDDLLKTQLATAICWTAGSHLMINAGVSKRMDYDPVLALDIHYAPFKRFDLVAGISSDLSPFYFGYSFLFSGLRIGMVSGYHFQLGFTPQITLSYGLKI